MVLTQKTNMGFQANGKKTQIWKSTKFDSDSLDITTFPNVERTHNITQIIRILDILCSGKESSVSVTRQRIL